MKKKQGISLIVLVITIIVIVVLATAVILSIANNNPIENAKTAVSTNNEKTVEEGVKLAAMSALTSGNGIIQGDEAYKSLNDGLKSVGYDGEDITSLPKVITINGISYLISEDGVVKSVKYIEIYTADELRSLVSLNNEGNISDDTIISLMNNITISGDWSSIGNEDMPFNANFEGNNHTITYSLTNKWSTDETVKVGLFGTSNGNITNLNVTGQLSGSSSTYGVLAGGVCISNYGNIYNCTSSVTIEVGGLTDKSGGIVAVNYGTIDSCTTESGASISETSLRIRS